MKKENILIVDDNYDMLELLSRNLKAMNYHTYKASSVNEAFNVLKYSKIDLLITDLQMPGKNGLELLKYVSENLPEMAKLVITGFPSVESAVSATKMGASDYLIKPFTGEEFRKAVQHALKSESQEPEPSETTANSYGGMVGKSKQFGELIEIIERVKDNRATVLITGESGTGKELVARAIHYSGAFANKPFIAVNCGALPETLVESELFGHVKGAFSGAIETKKGLFEAADGGTIFLDEIGTLPHNVQTRLLRVLQDKEVRKIGAHHSQKINLRIIAATNSNLPEMVKAKHFREDLYYRLNVVTIETTPLRERTDDIELLISTFLDKYTDEYGKDGVTISPEALEAFKSYSWPGNVRELENTVQRLVILAGNYITIKDLPQYIFAPQNQSSGGGLLPLKDIEKQHILKVLAAVGDNKTKAAEILQIDRKTLRSKLEQ
jgi:two-component system response regulator HydG